MKITFVPAGLFTLTTVDKEPHTFFELEETEELNEIIHDDLRPFVQRQRYTSISKLRKTKTTKDL